MLLILSAVTWLGAKVAVSSTCRPGQYFANSNVCSRFYQCGPDDRPFSLQCAPGLYYKIQTSKCDYAQNVNCASRGGYTHPGLEKEQGVTQDDAMYWGPSLPKGRCQHVYCSFWLKIKGSNPFTRADVDPRLCSHLVVKNVKLEPSGQLTLTSWHVPGNEEDGQSDVTRAFNELRRLKLNQSYPDVKLLAAVGYLGNTTTFTNILMQPDTHKKFASDVTSFLRAHGFDGLVIHVNVTYERMIFMA